MSLHVKVIAEGEGHVSDGSRSPGKVMSCFVVDSEILSQVVILFGLCRHLFIDVRYLSAGETGEL